MLTKGRNAPCVLKAKTSAILPTVGHQRYLGVSKGIDLVSLSADEMELVKNSPRPETSGEGRVRLAVGVGGGEGQYPEAFVQATLPQPRATRGLGPVEECKE